MKKYLSTTDLAKALNLSPSTVSRALNDSSAISQETKARVLKFAQSVGYQKNLHAYSLINQKTDTIGVILPGITSYFFTTVIKGIQQVIEPAGYNLIIFQSNESLQKEIDYIRYLNALRIDGLLYAPSSETTSHEHLLPLLDKGIAFVNFDRGLDGLNCHQVLSDDQEGAFYAVQHLIDIGCKRIAHIGGPKNVLNARNRLNGYKSALKSNGIAIDEHLIGESDFSIEKCIDSVSKMLQQKDRPDGIFAVNDAAALGCMSVAKDMGLAIPHDIAIVGYDDESYSKYFTPPLSTVSNPISEMGTTSAKLCLRQIQEGLAGPFEKILLKPKLIIRASSKKGRVLHYA